MKKLLLENLTKAMPTVGVATCDSVITGWTMDPQNKNHPDLRENHLHDTRTKQALCVVKKNLRQLGVKMRAFTKILH